MFWCTAAVCDALINVLIREAHLKLTSEGILQFEVSDGVQGVIGFSQANQLLEKEMRGWAMIRGHMGEHDFMVTPSNRLTHLQRVVPAVRIAPQGEPSADALLKEAFRIIADNAPCDERKKFITKCLAYLTSEYE